MSDPKLYRVSAVQPIQTATYVYANSPTDAIKMCKKDMDSDGNEIEWKDYDIGFWYDYEAEEMQIKYKIRYQDSMTKYLLEPSFNTRVQAKEYIHLNLGEQSLYEIVEVFDE